MRQETSDIQNPGFTLVLHSHIPWVLGHGNWPHGAVWLFEAAAETYVPLLDALCRLRDERIHPGATIGITPILAEQLTHNDFAGGFREYLRMKISAAVEDQRTFFKEGESHLADLARYWEGFYTQVERSFFDSYHADLVAAFRDLQEQGFIELITSCATHGYLPLISRDEAVIAQVKAGVDTYRRHFGRDPAGIWLPECGYRPGYSWKSPLEPDSEPFDRIGVERVLEAEGIRYFIIDSAMLKGGKPKGVYLERFEGLKRLWDQFEHEFSAIPERGQLSEYKVYTLDGESRHPVAVLTRDSQTGLQVWSGKHGYPGDSNYLEFHKRRFPGGHRYWKVTGANTDLADKQPYDPDAIEGRIEENADHFVNLLTRTLMDKGSGSVLCAPFDTELFGHWWFEGIHWLEKVWRKMAHCNIKPLTGRQAVQRIDSVTRIELPEGSWGEGGFHQIWLNSETRWCWKLIYEAEEIMVNRVNQLIGNSDSQVQALLESMGCELMLLEASDWSFVISTGSAPDYAELRIREHYDTFMKLEGFLTDLLENGMLTVDDQADFDNIRNRTDIFPALKSRLWKAPGGLSSQNEINRNQ